MGFFNVPNWIRILLLIATVQSFLPQIRLTTFRTRSTGVSTLAVLLNLISATEQFALTFYFVVNHFENPDIFVHDPTITGDWINLIQMGVVLILLFAFFIICLYLPCEHRDFSVISAVATYIAFLFVSIIPELTDAINPGRHEDRKWTMVLFYGVHSLYLSWIITALNVAAIFCQVKETLARPEHNRTLSRAGLAAQAVVFAVLAVSWIGRVNFPYEGFFDHFWSFLSSWFELVGWAAVDTGMFAIGQAFIFGSFQGKQF